MKQRNLVWLSAISLALALAFFGCDGTSGTKTDGGVNQQSRQTTTTSQSKTINLPLAAARYEYPGEDPKLKGLLVKSNPDGSISIEPRLDGPRGRYQVEVILDLRALAGTYPAIAELRKGKVISITTQARAVGAFVGTPPNVMAIVLKSVEGTGQDEKWASYYGWTHVPGDLSSPNGFTWHLNLADPPSVLADRSSEFDPSRIALVGVAFALGDRETSRATYKGEFIIQSLQVKFVP
jgi:hypothetical protein